jgi:uncharacterized protein YutE (UPF0331/DUF86 family)
VVRNGVIVAKLAIIEEYLKKLQEYFPVSLEQFKSDWGLQKIVERSLQVMIEVMIDIAERIIAQKSITPQKTAADTLKKLRELGIIQSDDAYSKMVRFRNLVVHQYDSIELGILYSIVQNNLDDFNKFVGEIKKYEGI